MSVEQLESAIQSLPPDERRRLARWFDDHRHELLMPLDESRGEDAESAQEREVLSRLAETEGSSAPLEAFEEADLDRMFQDFAHARGKKRPSRQG